MKIAIKNARALIQRSRDAKIFRGWMLDFAPPRASAIVQSASAVVVGDEFLISVCGHPKQCSFTAVLDSVRPATAMHSSGMSGSFLYDLRIGMSVSTQPRGEEPRFRVEGIEMEHHSPMRQECFNVDIADVGAAGFSVVSAREFATGQMMQVGINTGLNEITASVEVRNHRRIAGLQDRFRTGFQILSMDRLDTQRWQEFYNDVISQNTVDICLAPDHKMSA